MSQDPLYTVPVASTSGTPRAVAWGWAAHNLLGTKDPCLHFPSLAVNGGRRDILGAEAQRAEIPTESLILVPVPRLPWRLAFSDLPLKDASAGITWLTH